MIAKTPRKRSPRRRRRAARCQPLFTVFGTTVCLILLTAACGGAQRGDPYEEAVSEQEACCESLEDHDARARCMEKIVRVEDEGAAATDENRATYRCVERHFVCDPQTGSATPQAAQEALECIQDLSS